MSGNNFFGGGIGGTVTPRRRGGSIRWHGGLGSDNETPALDTSSFFAGIGTVLTCYAVVYFTSRAIPKAKRKVDSVLKKKGSIITKVPEATVKGAVEIVKEVVP